MSAKPAAKKLADNKKIEIGRRTEQAQPRPAASGYEGMFHVGCIDTGQRFFV
jgi:hypothetical protein